MTTKTLTEPGITELEVTYDENGDGRIECPKRPKSTDGYYIDLCLRCQFYRRSFHSFESSQGYACRLFSATTHPPTHVRCAHPDAKEKEKVDHLREALSKLEEIEGLFETGSRIEICINDAIEHIEDAIGEKEEEQTGSRH